MARYNYAITVDKVCLSGILSYGRGTDDVMQRPMILYELYEPNIT